MTDLPAEASAQTPLIGRAALIEEILQGVEQGRRGFALEGISGVGKTAVLAAVVEELSRRNYSPAVLNAIEQASEDLAIAAIYGQLKALPQDPEAVATAFGKRMSANGLKLVRAITAAVMADLAKVVTDKAGKTIDVLQKAVAGELLSSPIGEALDQLDSSNKRLFLSHFLGSLADAGTLVVISIDHVDKTNLPEFIRFLIAAKPDSTVLLLAHNTETGDNGRWDDITSDVRAKRGLLLPIAPLGPKEAAEWFYRSLGRWPLEAEINSLMQATGGRPYDLELALAAIQEGGAAILNDYAGYYEAKRSAITGDARTVAELLAILPDNVSVSADALAAAAACVGAADIGPALDRLAQDRLLKRTSSGLALTHALAQETWRQGITKPRGDKLVGSWYEVYRQFKADQLTSPEATAIIAVVVAPLVQSLPPAEIANLGSLLLKAGQHQVGLALIDNGWKFEPAGEKGGENMVQQALLAARTRLELGRYSEVDEPLAQAERSANEETQIEALLLRMKLALRRNTYVLLWALAKKLDAVTDNPEHQAAGQATLNVAYRDLLNYEGIQRTTDKLVQLRGSLPPGQQIAVDRSIARALAKLGNFDGALEAAEHAITGASDYGTARDLGNAYLARAEVRRYRREFAQALDDYHMAEQLGRGMGNRDSQLWSLLGAAAAQIESGDAQHARLPLDQVSALLAEPGYDHPIESAHAQLLRVLAGEDADVERLFADYKALGIEWPQPLLEERRRSGGVFKPTPL